LKASNRWLIIFGAAIVVLVVTALVLVLTIKPGTTARLPADTPEGTVQGYLMAIESGDYETAYAYISPPDNVKQTYDSWLRSLPQAASKPEVRVTLGKSTISGDTATLPVIIDSFRSGGPFGSNVSTNNVTFILSRTGGVWKINQPWEVWWLY
jgi:hypothetical protein